MTIGQMIKNRREALGLEVKDVAADAEMAYGYWYEIERDQASPSIRKLMSIARALKCQANELIPDESLLQKA